MAKTNSLEDKLNGKYVSKLLDSSGAAIATSAAIKAVIGGSYAPAALAYLVPYTAFKAAKYIYQAARYKQYRTLKAVGYAIKDYYRNILPYKRSNRVPAGVGAMATAVSYV